MIVEKWCCIHWSSSSSTKFKFGLSAAIRVLPESYSQNDWGTDSGELEITRARLSIAETKYLAS